MNNPTKAFGNHQTLLEEDVTQKNLKKTLETNKNLRFLRENPNITYDTDKQTIAGWSQTGLVTLKITDIIDAVNHVDTLLGQK